MAEFQYTPIEGFENKLSFPNPASEDEARAQVQSLLNQARDAINQLELLKATKEELQGIVLNQVPDGSITDAKLSNAAGQVKSVLSTKQKAITISTIAPTAPALNDIWIQI